MHSDDDNPPDYPPDYPREYPPDRSSGVSDRQLAANRANARRSAGPATDGGRARSAFNGLKHGLYSREVVLPGEDLAAYDDLLASMRTDLKPEGRVEDGLVRRAADIWWRLGRSAAIEAGLLNPDWSGDPRAQRLRTGGGPLVDGFRVAMDDTATLDRLGRYEARLERALKRTFEILAGLQERRRASARAEAAHGCSHG